VSARPAEGDEPPLNEENFVAPRPSPAPATPRPVHQQAASRRHTPVPLAATDEVSFSDVSWTAPPSLYPLDPVKAVRDQVLALGLERCAVVLVSGSPEARERKVRLAAQLALALADTGHPRVLLLEGDMESPGVIRTLGLDMPMSAGLSQQLEAQVRRSASGGPLTILRCSPSLHVLGEGVIRSPGIVLSVVFEVAVLTFRKHFDVIVIDGPPAAQSMELHAINALVDGVIIADPNLRGGAFAVPAAPGPLVRGLFGDKRLLVAVPA
jgi:Mrp family chromosome partitioning ATPase